MDRKIKDIQNQNERGWLRDEKEGSGCHIMGHSATE